ncbi:MAG: hypothetical protein WCD18_01880 [Thermosynechococcaceae cyanobacterium]
MMHCSVLKDIAILETASGDRPIRQLPSASVRRPDLGYKTLLPEDARSLRQV